MTQVFQTLIHKLVSHIGGTERLGVGHRLLHTAVAQFHSRLNGDGLRFPDTFITHQLFYAHTVEQHQTTTTVGQNLAHQLFGILLPRTAANQDGKQLGTSQLRCTLANQLLSRTTLGINITHGYMVHIFNECLVKFRKFIYFMHYITHLYSYFYLNSTLNSRRYTNTTPHGNNS